MSPSKRRIQDTSTGEMATAHEEVDYIVDAPYLVFTLDGRATIPPSSRG